jgi:hypothetical protein
MQKEYMVLQCRTKGYHYHGGTMVCERRRKRSSFSGLALQYWLAAIAQRDRLFALVVADSAGLLVAASMKGPEAEELAAIAPLLVRPMSDGPSGSDHPRVPMVIRKMRLDQASLFLCAVGNQEKSQTSLRMAEDGVRRILATH